jgi:hypothetical protein
LQLGTCNSIDEQTTHLQLQAHDICGKEKNKFWFSGDFKNFVFMMNGSKDLEKQNARV